MEIYNLKEQIISFVFHPSKENWLYSLRPTFIIISLLFSILLIILLFKNTFLWRLFIEDWMEFFTWRAFGISITERNWKKVKQRLSTGQESEYKLAIIEADKILGDVLRRMEYRGKEINEILNKLSPTAVPFLEEIKWAHNIHECIVQDPDFRLSLDDTKKAMDIYEKFFIDAEVL